MYEVGDVLPVETVPAGTNLLVAGPPMTDKRTVAYELLATGCGRGEGGLLVTTRDGVARVRDRYPALAAAMAEGRAGVVDCVSRGRGLEPPADPAVRYVGSPGEVTDLGIRVGGYLRDLARRGLPGRRVGVVSLSTMLMYVELRRLFRFVHVLTGKVQATDSLGVAVLQPSDPAALDRLAPLFDGVVRTREADSGTEVRVVGAGHRTGWTPL